MGTIDDAKAANMKLAAATVDGVTVPVYQNSKPLAVHEKMLRLEEKKRPAGSLHVCKAKRTRLTKGSRAAKEATV